MSAIWGMVDLNNEKMNPDMALWMEAPYHTYKIDSYQKFTSENLLFGYGGQYFTKEALKEAQPIAADGESVIFAADAVLDNREELFQLLGTKQEEREEIPDGTLMFRILRKYGRKSYPMFLGTYAFAYYEREKQELTLVADAVGSRCLYYLKEAGKIYFSTLIKPILKARNADIEWNYRFFTDYLAMDNLALYTEAEETPYNNLYKVAPGQEVRINLRGIRKSDYWDTRCVKRTPRKSDAKIKEELVGLFHSCVAGVMRSSERTGILLSGGLDSTSVACFAAPLLKERDETLYSYTSVPERDYVPKTKTLYITDERKTVEITERYLGNMECSFLELPGENGFNGAAEYMEQLELPYKSLQNIKWLYACADKAAGDGCRILLTGIFGNTTISLGNYKKQFYSLFRKCRLIELIREADAFSRINHIGRKNTCRYLLHIIRTNIIKKRKSKEDVFQKVYVNPLLLEKYKTEKRLQKYDRTREKLLTLSGRALRPELFFRPIFIQLGEFETHFSLLTGVLQRDPTRDRRLIEYCMSLRDNQFVFRGTERRLVREYFREYLPGEILADTRHRGLQSADMTRRLSRSWNSIYQECISLLGDDRASKLLDVPKARAKLEEYKEQLPDEEDFEIMKLLYSILLVRYIRPVG